MDNKDQIIAILHSIFKTVTINPETGTSTWDYDLAKVPDTAKPSDIELDSMNMYVSMIYLEDLFSLDSNKIQELANDKQLLMKDIIDYVVQNHKQLPSEDQLASLVK